MSEPINAPEAGLMRRALRSPIIRYSLLALAVVVAQALIIGGFTTAVEATNTMEFCTSCHDMSYNLEEYKRTVHYSNPSGVRAVCSDCHVPKKNWFSEMKRKLVAGSDVCAEVIGTINTKEKFEAKRMEMAKREWARMKESDSIGCRNCHSFEGMDIESQGKSAKNQHADAAMASSGKTCIDCHKGIAHKLPRVQ
ncbi:MAG: NapC/NirT family cytochrome c [Sideroxydans sp.]|nr:NapC/NirT family cytochrome c [Sideroxydans sp.]